MAKGRVCMYSSSAESAAATKEHEVSFVLSLGITAIKITLEFFFAHSHAQTHTTHRRLLSVSLTESLYNAQNARSIRTVSSLVVDRPPGRA